MTIHPNEACDVLLLAWGRGWAASRGTPPPVPLVDGGWRIEVGLPGHRRRDLLPAWGVERLRARAEDITSPGHWIKALIQWPGLVMSSALARKRSTPQAGSRSRRR